MSEYGHRRNVGSRLERLLKYSSHLPPEEVDLLWLLQRQVKEPAKAEVCAPRLTDAELAEASRDPWGWLGKQMAAPDMRGTGTVATGYCIVTIVHAHVLGVAVRMTTALPPEKLGTMLDGMPLVY